MKKNYSAIEDVLYYGTINPLENNYFNETKVNPLGVSAESDGVCFTTSPTEATKVYAQPPIQLTESATLEEILEARRSEWYSKAEAFIHKRDSVKIGMAVNQDELSALKNEWTKNASPCIYKCNAIVSKPFIVSKSIGMNVGEYRDLDEMDNIVISKRYKDTVDLGKYEQPLRMVLFNALNKDGKVISMTDVVEKVNAMFVQYANRTRRDIEKMSTQSFYLFIKEKMGELNIQGLHSKVINGVNDSIVIENTKEIYANANYDNNKHILVFDVKNIVFSLSDSANLAQINIIDNEFKVENKSVVNSTLKNKNKNN